MIASLCRHLAGNPTFADLAFLEVFSPGSEAIRWRSGRPCLRPVDAIVTEVSGEIETSLPERLRSAARS